MENNTQDDQQTHENHESVPESQSSQHPNETNDHPHSTQHPPADSNSSLNNQDKTPSKNSENTPSAQQGEITSLHEEIGESKLKPASPREEQPKAAASGALIKHKTSTENELDEFLRTENSVNTKMFTEPIDEGLREDIKTLEIGDEENLLDDPFDFKHTHDFHPLEETKDHHHFTVPEEKKTETEEKPKAEASENVINDSEKVEVPESGKIEVPESEKIDSSQKIEVPEKAEDSDKVEALEKEEAAEKVEALDKAVAVDKVEAAEKVEALDKVGSVDKVEATEKVETSEKVDEPAKEAKDQKPKKAAKKPAPAKPKYDRFTSIDERIAEAVPQKNFDELPVGGGGGSSQLSEYPEGMEPFPTGGQAEAPQETGPLSTRVKSKVWKIRQNAFEELSQKFNEANSSDPIFDEYASDLEKFIADSNPGAQEKALDSLKVYLQKKGGVSLDTQSLTKTLIDKALGPAKPNIKILSIDILCQIFEKMDRQALFEGLIESINHKNQKTSCAGVQGVVELLKNYGPRKLDFLKPFFPHVEKLAASTVSSLRGEAMNFYKEGYRFMGEAIKPFLTKLKKIQVEELEKFFAESPKELAKPLREEEMKRQEEEGKGADTKTGGKKQGGDEGFDPYEISDPVDIFKKYNEKWTQKVLGLEKWNEKKAALEEFLKEIETTPKLANVPFQHITAMLKKLLNDNNFPIVSVTVRIYGGLAKGLRKPFAGPCKLIMPFLLEKLKDKRSALIDETTRTLDNFLYCINLDDVLEDLKEGLANKSPNMRMSLLSWVDRYFERNAKTPEKLINVFKTLLPLIKKLVDDSSNEVREASTKTLAKQKIILGDAIVKDSFDDLNPSRLTKINNMVSSATGVPVSEGGESTGKSSEISVVSPRATIKGKGGFSATVEHHEEEKSPKPTTAKGGKPDVKTGTTTVPQSAKKTDNDPKKSAVKDTSKTQSTKTPQAAQATHEIEALEIEVTSDEIEAKIAEINLPENIKHGLNDPLWKEKQKAVAEFSQWAADNTDVVNQSLETLLQFLKIKLKDWKESNPNVVKETYQFLANVAGNKDIVLTKKSFSLILPFIMMNIAEAKYTPVSQAIIYSFIEAIHPKYIILTLMNAAQDKAAKPNPKAAAEICNILAKLVDELTLRLFPLKETIEFGKIVLAVPLPVGKNAAFSLYKALYQQFGPPLNDFLTDLNPTVLKSLQAEFGKIQFKKDAQCKVHFRSEAEKETKAELTGTFDPLGAFPRADISRDIEKVTKKLNDHDWKVKQEGLETLDGMLAANGNRISANGLNNLVIILKHRLNDNNKNQVKNIIMSVGKLAYALGSEGKAYAKDLLPEVIKNLSDKQAPIRAEAIKALERFGEAVGHEVVINYVLQALANESPELRIEVINFILKHSQSLPKADVKGNVKTMLSVLQDKTKEIRTLSEKLVEKCIGIIGVDPYMAVIKDMKPAIRDVLKPIINKYGGHLEEPSTENVETSFDKSKGSSPIQRSLKKTASEATLRTTQQLKSTASKLQGANTSTVKPRVEESKANRSMQNINLSNSSLNNSLSSGAELPSYPKSINSVGEKNKRQEEDKKTRWPTEELRDDLVNKVRDHLKKNVSKDLFAKMFSTDPKKHVEAVKVLSKALIVEFQDTVDILDIILRWFFIRLWDNVNTQMMKESLDYFFSLTMSLEAAKYTLLDFEANVIVPCLVNRLGTGPSNLKISLHKIFPKLGGICPPQKVAGFLVDALRSRSHKTKIESIEVLAEMVKAYGSDILSQKDIKTYGKLLADNDVNVKANALKLMIEIGHYLGEGLLSLIGTDVPPKLMEIVQQPRIMTASPPVSFREGEEQDVFNKSKVELASDFGQIKEEVEEEQALAMSQSKPRVKKAEKSSDASPQRNFKEENEKEVIQEEERSEDMIKTHRDQPMNDEEEIKHELGDVVLLGGKVEEALFEKCLKLLKEGSIDGKLDALLFIQDIITSENQENREFLEMKANSFLNVLQSVLNNILTKSSKEASFKFLSFFLELLHKLASLKSFVKGASEDSLQSLFETLFQKLLLLTEPVMSRVPENALIMKTMNSIVLRLLENSNPNNSLIALYGLATKCQKNQNDSRITGLVVKCILKLVGSMDHFRSVITPSRILMEMHKYLIVHENNNPESEEDILLMTVKITLRKLVELFGDKINESYAQTIEPHPISDEYMKGWIAALLRSQTDKSWTPQGSSNPDQQEQASVRELVESLTKTTNFDQIIEQIYDELHKYPGHSVVPYLEGKKESFKSYVLSALERLHYEKTTMDSENLLGKAKNGCHIKPIIAQAKENKEEEVADKETDDLLKRMNTLKIRFALMTKNGNVEFNKLENETELLRDLMKNRIQYRQPKAREENTKEEVDEGKKQTEDEESNQTANGVQKEKEINEEEKQENKTEDEKVNDNEKVEEKQEENKEDKKEVETITENENDKSEGQQIQGEASPEKPIIVKEGDQKDVEEQKTTEDGAKQPKEESKSPVKETENAGEKGEAIVDENTTETKEKKITEGGSQQPSPLKEGEKTPSFGN